jgi:hypothetical protein
MALTAFGAIGQLVGIGLVFSGFSLPMIMLAERTAFDRRETFCIGGGFFHSDGQ